MMASWLIIIACVFLCIFLIVRLLDQITVNIKGRYIFITGCDTGFGNLLAKSLDRKGCNVFAACLTEKGAAELKASTSDRLQTVVMDVTNSESIRAAFKEVRSFIPESEGLWGVVNNAGINSNIGWYDWWTREEIRRVLEVNLLGTVEVTSVFLPLVKKVKGRIVNVSSALGIVPMATGGYSMSKFAVESFSDGLRHVMKPFGVSVHIIEPGVFRTESTNGAVNVFPKLERAWQRLPKEVREEEYGEECFENYKSLYKRYLADASPKLHLVIEAMEHALTARLPWRRYLPGWEAKYVAKPLSMMPSFIVEFLGKFIFPVPIPRCCKK